jgi:hypothetical protein
VGEWHPRVRERRGNRGAARRGHSALKTAGL